MESIYAVLAAVGGFAAAGLFGRWLLVRNQGREAPLFQKFPELFYHRVATGTLPFGGVMLAAGILAGLLIGIVARALSGGGTEEAYRLQLPLLTAGLFMAGAYGFLSIFEFSYQSKNGKGFSWGIRLLLQALIAAVYLFGTAMAGYDSTIVILPFFGQLQMGLAYYPLALVLIVAVVNGVRFTARTDGLSGSLLAVICCGLVLISTRLYAVSSGILAAAVAGAALGLLIYNFSPAKIGTGESGGSLLGGILVALTFSLGIPVLLVPLGLVFLLESGTVFLGKLRLLSGIEPFSVRLQEKGWSGKRVIAIYGLITFVGTAVSVAGIFYI